jgi:DNA repair protein RadC
MVFSLLTLLLYYRVAMFQATLRLRKPLSHSVYSCSKPFTALIEQKETFKMLLLNRANKVLGITTISEGGLSGTVTDVRLIYQYAIKGNCSGIIVAHNHPSGNQNPSESDLKITQKIKEAGNLLDIQLLDHIILTPEKEIFRSLADEGQL